MNVHAPIFHSEHDHFEKAREYQEYVQRELEPYGVGQIPGPVHGQKALAYERETNALLKRQFLPKDHEQWKINYTGPNRIPHRRSQAVRRPAHRRLQEGSLQSGHCPSWRVS